MAEVLVEYKFWKRNHLYTFISISLSIYNKRVWLKSSRSPKIVVLSISLSLPLSLLLTTQAKIGTKESPKKSGNFSFRATTRVQSHSSGEILTSFHLFTWNNNDNNELTAFTSSHPDLNDWCYSQFTSLQRQLMDTFSALVQASFESTTHFGCQSWLFFVNLLPEGAVRRISTFIPPSFWSLAKLKLQFPWLNLTKYMSRASTFQTTIENRSILPLKKRMCLLIMIWDGRTYWIRRSRSRRVKVGTTMVTKQDLSVSILLTKIIIWFKLNL